MVVKQNTVVSLRYIMKNGAGEVLENGMDREPVEYIHGAGRIIPQLEQELEGLREGERRSVSLNTGGPEGMFHFDVVIDRLRAAEPDELTSGVPGKRTGNSGCGPGCCC